MKFTGLRKVFVIVEVDGNVEYKAELRNATIDINRDFEHSFYGHVALPAKLNLSGFIVPSDFIAEPAAPATSIVDDYELALLSNEIKSALTD